MVGQDKNILFTVGHSNHPLERFVELLVLNGITAVADVRSVPYSRHCQQFNREALSAVLRKAGLAYVFLGNELGARPADLNCYEAGRVSFSKLAVTPEFRHGLERLRKGMTTQRIALMCSEKDPIYCHRMILICHEFRDGQIAVRHILDDGTTEENRAAELRLMRSLNLATDLFDQQVAPTQMLEQAYETQARNIAYRSAGASAPSSDVGVQLPRKVRILTIGFTKKSAREFFSKLRGANVKRLIDIRLNNESQLAGFTKRDDLEFFVQELLHADYRHLPELAPTKEILDQYKKKAIGWDEYEGRFLALLRERRVEASLAREDFEDACLLCSEPIADKCHRRLVAEYVKESWAGVVIEHL